MPLATTLNTVIRDLEAYDGGYKAGFGQEGILFRLAYDLDIHGPARMIRLLDGMNRINDCLK